MLTETEYKQARAILAKAEQVLQATAPDVAKRGGAIPAEVTDHPAWKAATNDLRGKVEQYELLNDTPETFVAYIGEPAKNGMGCNRVAGQFYPVTVWTGEVICNATKGSTWHVNSHIGSHMHQFYARLNDREFTGRGFGTGMCIVFRETAASKRNRS